MGGGVQGQHPKRGLLDANSLWEIAAPSTVDWLSAAYVSLPSPGVPGRCKQGLGYPGVSIVQLWPGAYSRNTCPRGLFNCAKALG